MSKVKKDCANTDSYLTMLDSATNDGQKNKVMVRQLGIYTNEHNEDIIKFTNNSPKARLFIRALEEHNISPRIKKTGFQVKLLLP